MTQPPVGFGWIAQPDQPAFPYSSMGPPPPGPSPMAPGWDLDGGGGPPLYAGSFGGPPPPGPPIMGMGWSQPPERGFGPTGMAPPPPPGASIGFDFATPAETPSAFAEPSAPPMSETPEFSDVSKVEAGVRTVPITIIPSRPKPPRPPSPKLVSPSKPSPSPQPNHTPSSRQQDSRYQEGLKTMADLMTDVDLTDDVLTDLKKRFDTNR
ncbi:unnamed protein product [Calicophoron daubneyi]|uniref:Uncharacterized protein n=1 Tax=Calicophoron daubneyi TaxID=300641 RepID=A0AAV2T5C8_CALDB